jgi:hypothetical protein
MPLNRVRILSPNYSSRGGSAVTTIVLHTAEGATTYQSLGSYFANPASQVSSHVGIDDTPGTIGEYVDRPNKAWTAGNANPWSVQAELCAFAKWSPADWQAHPQMLANTAAWIAEEAAAFGIPIVSLSAADAQNPNARGVCQHNDLGAMGGGHWDCGPGFPIDQVLSMAKGGASPLPPQPEAPKLYYGNGGQEDSNVAICTHPNGKRIDMCVIAPDQSVAHYFTDDSADLNKMKAENLGGTGKSVTCCWLDGNRFQVAVHGSNDQVWANLNNAGKWQGWRQIPNTPLAAE